MTQLTSNKAKRRIARPTAGELAILRVLWERSECTVRDVHEQLNPNGGNSYTTTLKLMQIMHQKGLVERNDSQRAHIYKPCCSRKDEQQAFVSELANRLFNGSATRLALQALGQTGDVNPEELAEIKQLIEKLEKSSE